MDYGSIDFKDLLVGNKCYNNVNSPSQSRFLKFYRTVGSILEETNSMINLTILIFDNLPWVWDTKDK